MNEDKKIKYTLWIAIIGLLTVIITQWSVLFPSKAEPNRQPVQPTINIINEINNNDNQNQKTTNPNEPTIRANNEGKTNLPERIIMKEPVKTEKETYCQYISKIKDVEGKGVANVKIYCPNCLKKKCRLILTVISLWKVTLMKVLHFGNQPLQFR